MKRFAIALVLLMACAGMASALETYDIGFPFKAFVYHAAKIPPSEYSKVQIQTNTPYYFVFDYNGTNYNAELFVYGAIYLKRQGMNPLLISFDISEYRAFGR